MCGGQRTTVGVGSLLQPCGAWDQTQGVITSGRKGLYPLSHLASSSSMLSQCLHFTGCRLSVLFHKSWSSQAKRSLPHFTDEEKEAT